MMLSDEMISRFNKIFSILQLSDREIEIIKLRFGFYDEIYSLREIGIKFNISHQRVNEIINRILQKIKLSRCAEELFEFTDDVDNSRKNVDEYRKNNERKMKRLLKKM